MTYFTLLCGTSGATSYYLYSPHTIENRISLEELVALGETGVTIPERDESVFPPILTGNTATLIASYNEEAGTYSFRLKLSEETQTNVIQEAGTKLHLEAGKPNPIDLTPALNNIGGVIEDSIANEEIQTTYEPVTFTNNSIISVNVRIGMTNTSLYNIDSSGSSILINVNQE